ncbi:phage tail tape measure protein [Tissierella sp. MSJ-40]|uniref:Phage tail tape measure protein n=1 Tax=Tissierella simiarum TaxID=2841534 RepID=A0ABS6EDI3_9FIRM|nr:phage tail tape measure protein [Tissierella simiarum]MBU5440289.1 phage tail tape measure protein [Tissierella simiarum]
MGAVGTTLKLFDNFSQPLNGVFQSLDKVLRVMENLDTTAGNMDLTKSIREARTDIGAFTTQINEMTQGLQEAENKNNDLFNSFKKYIGIGAAIEGGRRAFDTGMTYDDASRQVMAITGDNSPEMVQQINKYTTAFATGGLTKKDIAEGYQFTSLAGWDFDESTFAMPIMRDLKRVTGAEFGRISDLVTDSMTPLKISIDKLPEFADQMARTQNISNTNMEQLLNAYQGGAFKGVQTGKMSMPELNSLIGVLGNAGIKGAEAGTQVRNIMNGLYGTEKKTQQILEKMGIEVYKNGEARNAFDLLQEFGTKLNQYNDESQKKIMSGMFNVYDEVGLNALMTQLDKLPEYRDQIEQSDGALNDMINTIDGGIGGKVRGFLSNFNTWLVGLGATLEPVAMLLLTIAQSDIGSTFFVLIQMVAGGIGFLATMLIMLFSAIDPLAPIIWGLIAAMGVLWIAKSAEAMQTKVQTLLTQQGIFATIAKTIAEKKLLSAIFMSIPALIKEAIMKIAAISPILAIIAVIGAVIIVLVALAQKFDWLREGMITAINGMIKGVNWLLEQVSKIPVVGKLVGDFRIQELDKETGLKFRNPFEDMFDLDKLMGELPETPEMPELPEIPSKLDIGNVDKVSRVDKNREVDISDEDIKLLRDVAMKEAVVQYNNFKLESSVAFGDVHQTADMDGIPKIIEQMLEEQIAISTELSYG